MRNIQMKVDLDSLAESIADYEDYVILDFIAQIDEKAQDANLTEMIIRRLCTALKNEGAEEESDLSFIDWRKV